MILIPSKVRKVWNATEIRALVLLSLFLQILLILFAVFRKRSAIRALSFLLWASYLGADYIATLALGNLLSKQTQDQGNNHNQGINGDLVALWAPFLLLHLGGPDAITSYSLEDNELWLRHLLGLLVQVSTAVLAFLSSLPNPGLWQPAIAVFISGTWKFGERTWALRSASMDELRESMVTDPDPGPNYVKFMQEYASRIEAGLEAQIKIEKEPQPRPQLSEVKVEDIKDPTEVTFEAYRLFTTFKRLSVDLMLSFQDRIESQYFFFARSAIQAFKVVEIELSFLYDILHTKANLVHCVTGRVLRFLALCTTVSAAVLFHITRSHHFNKADIAITYVLLGAAVCLEIVSIVLLLLSDWMIVMLRERKLLRCAKFVHIVVDFFLPKGKKRWSNSMRQYNLLKLCLKDHKMTKFKRVMKFLRLKEPWDNFWYIDRPDVPDNLKKLIFEELKEKAKSAEGSEDYKRLRACRGEWVLQRKGYTQFDWSVKREYDESILLWHIATDLLFPHSSETNNDDTTKEEVPKICRLISNYMLYLLVMQPSMLPAGIGKIRYQDTSAEAKKFFSTEATEPAKTKACNMLLDVNAEVEPIEVKGDRSKSVLFDACRLATQLKREVEDDAKRWKLISVVWVEMLGYAASNCRSYFHAKQLSLGGELLTHVWLMMAHMGIGEQYRIESGHARAKLIVNK